jgi:hypothetical protein
MDYKHGLQTMCPSVRRRSGSVFCGGTGHREFLWRNRPQRISMAEPATEIMSYFLLARAGRPGQPLGGGDSTGWPLAFFNSYLLLYTFE